MTVYRYLSTNDIIQDGDEFYIGVDKSWHLSNNQGKHPEPDMKYRRKVLHDYTNTTTLPETPSDTDAESLLPGIEAAIKGEKGPAQQALATVGMTLVQTLLNKNTDYGNSAMTPPLLAPGMAAREAIQCRMSDKVCRLQRLLAGNKANVDESIEDTMKDLGGYAILWLATAN